MVHVAAGAVVHHHMSVKTQNQLAHPRAADLEQQKQQLQQQQQLAVTMMKWMMVWMLMCLMRPALC
jgi:hypothetical protein